MTPVVHLLGRPHIEGRPGGYRIRSRKSWALLAYLLLGERPPSRSQLAALLFDEADDPLAALRWGLAELRRALGPGAVVEGDPVVLRLPPGALVDARVVLGGSWEEAIALPGLGSELLADHPTRGAAAFESWLLSAQRRVLAASEEILHEAALASLSRDALDDAIAYAVRLVATTPLDENHHALLIRLYRLDGDDAAAQRQLATCTEILERELGVQPGAVVRSALRETRRDPRGAPTDLASVEATLEAGRAAVSAGAIETGADSLRTAVRGADSVGEPRLQVRTRLVLAEALVHALGGLDEEGMAALQGADDIALADGDRASVAEARAELGYVDFLRGRYDRARVWLAQALEYADGAELVTAKATTYLGSVESDQGHYAWPWPISAEADRLARSAGDLRRAAYASSMTGTDPPAAPRPRPRDRAPGRVAGPRRAGPLAGVHAVAAVAAGRGRAGARRRGIGRARCWSSPSPGPAGSVTPAGKACRPRGLALVAAAQDDTERAFDVLADARARANRLNDPYLWLDGYILDAQCELGLAHRHPDTPRVGRGAARAGLAHRDARAHRAVTAARGCARPARRRRRRPPAGGRRRQPGASVGSSRASRKRLRQPS